MLFNQFEGAVPDTALTMLAGAASGAAFRSPRGPRQAAAAGLVGSVGAGVLTVLRQFYPSL